MEINMDPLQKQMLDDVFDAFTMLSDGAIVSLMHVDGGFTRYTASAVELFGLPGEYIPNGAMDWTEWVHPEDRRRYLDVMIPLLEGNAQSYDLTYRVRTVSQGYMSFHLVGSVLRGADGKPSLIGGAMFNEEMTGGTDPVTVLPNKNTYLNELKKRMEAGRTTVSLQVGVSRYSEVNQVHGYSYGNRLLQEIGWLLQETADGRASVYRLDGPTFALLFESVSREEIAAIYDHIRYLLQRGVEVNGARNVLIASAGMVSTYTAEASAETVCSCLGYAYRESRQNHHGELVDFNGGSNREGESALKRLNAIRDSVLEDCRGFRMEYEPVVAADTERPMGAEASVLWEGEGFGRVRGCEFLPILEHDFIFEELGDFLLRRSLEDGVRFTRKDPEFLLCVGVYRMQVEADYFMDDLQRLLDETGFPGRNLSLKLMGDYRSIDPERIKTLLEEARSRGVRIVAGGFGGGRDSIGFLKANPVDGVSVDVRFMRGVETPGRDREILGHLALLASDCVPYINLGGVDTQEAREAVRAIPASTLQGGFFSPPVDAEQLLKDRER